jgi:hypothetical protein
MKQEIDNNVLNSRSSQDPWLFRTGVRRLLVASMFGVLGLACVVLQYRGQLRIDSDTVSYSVRMLLLSRGQILEPSVVWPLGWPLLGLPLFFFGLPPLYCFITLAAVSFIILLWCAGEIIYPKFGPFPTFVVFIVIAIEPYFSSEIWPGLSDVPFSAVIALFMLLCMRDVSFWNSFMLGATASLACYLRYPGLFLFFTVPILQLIRCCSLKDRFVHGAVAWISLALLTSPLFIRNFLASGHILWTNPAKTGSLIDTAMLWVFYHFRAALLFPTSWLSMFRDNLILGYGLVAIGCVALIAIVGLSLTLRRYRPVLVSFLIMGMYTGAMVLPKFHVESRYLMPEIFLLLIWIVATAEIIGKRYPRLRIVLLNLLMVHAVMAATYMSIRAYHLEGAPNVAKCINEFRSQQHPKDKTAVVAGNSSYLFALISDLKRINVDPERPSTALATIRATGQTIVLAAAGRGPRDSPNPVFTPWAGLLEHWVQIFPAEFRVRYRGQWLFVVEYSGKEHYNE